MLATHGVQRCRSMRESKVEAHLVKMVELTDGIIRKVQWIGRRGAPDRWCGWPQTDQVIGRSAWVELKKPTTPHAAAHQAREHARLRACGEQVYVLATIEEIDRFIHSMTGLG